MELKTPENIYEITMKELQRAYLKGALDRKICPIIPDARSISNPTIFRFVLFSHQNLNLFVHTFRYIHSFKSIPRIREFQSVVKLPNLFHLFTCYR